ncbi:hypothetical protein [Streptomyces sp. NPDC059003]|uniref:hypothetical protein n=1 Tax=Streptomyces sp. NPDC059003 TaxID=3346691 RepID=UPI0036983FAC
MSGVVQKLSERTWPGFEEFKTYFMSCSGAFPQPPNIHVQGDMIAFGADTSDIAELDKCMNSNVFRLMWNLLPAGMDIVAACSQLYALKNRKLMGLDGLSGTYMLRIKTCQRVKEYQEEQEHIQEHQVRRYESVQSSYCPAQFTVCL